MIERLYPAAAAAAAVALTPLAAAQQEQPREGGAYTEASASLGVAVNSGNTDSERYNANAEYLERSDGYRYVLGLEIHRGESDGEQDVNNSRLSGSYDWFFDGAWYANSSASWLQDRERDIRGRYVIGAGAGYQFFDNERLRLSAEAGPSYISEEPTGGGERTEDAALRWALDYRQNLADSTVRLFHRHEIVVAASDAQDWFATTRTGLRLPVQGGLSASLELSYDYDNQTTEAYHYDAATLANLAYTW